MALGILSGVDFRVRACVKTRTFYVAPPLEFPLSVRATFKRELQIFTHKFTPLSLSGGFIREVGNVERQYCLLEVVICKGHSVQLSDITGHSLCERDV